jgi:hypothetical protein
VIVPGAELEELQVSRAERRHVIHDAFDRSQAFGGNLGAARARDYYPDLPGPAERDDHKRSYGHFELVRNEKIKGLVEGHIESDTGDVHTLEKRLFGRLKSLWISL